MFSCMGCRSKKKKKGDKDAKDKAPRKKSSKKKGGDKVSVGQRFVGLIMSRELRGEVVVVQIGSNVSDKNRQWVFPVMRQANNGD